MQKRKQGTRKESMEESSKELGKKVWKKSSKCSSVESTQEKNKELEHRPCKEGHEELLKNACKIEASNWASVNARKVARN